MSKHSDWAVLNQVPRSAQLLCSDVYYWVCAMLYACMKLPSFGSTYLHLVLLLHLGTSCTQPVCQNPLGFALIHVGVQTGVSRRLTASLAPFLVGWHQKSSVRNLSIRSTNYRTPNPLSLVQEVSDEMCAQGAVHGPKPLGAGVPLIVNMERTADAKHIWRYSERCIFFLCIQQVDHR